MVRTIFFLAVADPSIRKRTIKIDMEKRSQL